MNRFEKIAGVLSGAGLDSILLLGPANRFYATGFPSPAGDAMALITAAGDAFYFTDARYMEAAEQHITQAAFGLVHAGQGYLSLCRQMMERCGLKRVGFEQSVMTVAQWEQYRTLPVELIAADDVLAQLRLVKEPIELAAMRGAQAIAEHAFLELLEELHPGMTEKQIAARLQYRMLCAGAQGLSFEPIVASGVNSSLPHAVPTDKPLAAGEFLTLDFGCLYDGYCSDTTRTIAIASASEEMRHVYETVRQAQLAGIAAVAAGVSGAEVDAAARACIEAAGYGAYFGHSFGHGIGVEVHEGPRVAQGSQAALSANAVISAEPGIYLPGRFGVRIEDMLCITDGGCENLTRLEKNLLVI